MNESQKERLALALTLLAGLAAWGTIMSMLWRALAVPSLA